MTVPVYDIPESPILIVGFFGILFTLVLLYFVNRDYFASPLNRDRRTKVMAVRFNPGTPTIESRPKKTRQGKSVNTILAPTSRNKRKKKYRGQGR